ncbi:DUF4159 domain-containing protein [Bauldia sp.]|uniref:DUF4159 domain-containing protein n=1 Tax=Bauldia sp. TaxID=2575872 RepID=UPI003BAD78FD
MSGLPFAFAYPPILLALLVLPLIWFLLRVTPPKPKTETFPPTRLLLEITPKEEQPAQTPWWLILLRCLIAAALIVALAGPIYKPSADRAAGSGPLLVVVDNGWASAPRWSRTVDTARQVIRDAEEDARPITVIGTADGTGQELAPGDAAEALRRLDAMAPRPYAADYAALTTAIDVARGETPFGGVAWLSDGLGGNANAAFAGFLSNAVDGDILVYADPDRDIVGLVPPTGGASALTVPVVRQSSGPTTAGFVRATDIRGRSIGDFPFTIAGDATSGNAEIDLPVELRNDIARLEIVGNETAGAVQLLDERWRRRRVGLLSGAAADTAQPLLSPLYYIGRAVEPFADIYEPRDANAAVAVPELIDSGVSIIAMADIGTLPPEVEDEVSRWIAEGGTLVRFAGPRLATATDSLVPVRLRQGDRVLGGSLTWQEEQPLARFAQTGPFAGLDIPADVLVKRQVLAEPDGTLAQRTWAALDDGTPLVTAAPFGDGWLVLFHVTADTSWSNLPLSGTFVDMLRQVVAFSSAARAERTPESQNDVATVPPFRLLDGYGRFVTPGPDAQPIPATGAEPVPGPNHPPGLYGTEEGFRSLNLLSETTALTPLDLSIIPDATVIPYPDETPLDLRPWLLALALALFLADALAVLWLNRALTFRRPQAAATILAIAIAVGLAYQPTPVSADDEADQFAVDAVSQTRLAYVETGNDEIDTVSAAGLRGLTRILAERTALEPGDPMGIDPARDELAFYPLLYWPIDADGPLPDSATMARVEAYMRQGGSVLFDTRDQLERSTSFGSFSGTPAVERLREMLASLDIPPLEPVPGDHVLTKAFYLLTEFPGRYAGGPLWVEAMADETARTDRPAQAGDGVSSILITENDFAAAWAMSDDGELLYTTVPADPIQREMAFRTGVNIVMYTLTGNYKADQVHVPALLERLGQ